MDRLTVWAGRSCTARVAAEPQAQPARVGQAAAGSGDVLVQAHRWFVTVLAANGGLRDGLDPRRAADIVFGLLSHELYRLLVIEQGWSPEDWERCGRPIPWPRSSCPHAEPQKALTMAVPERVRWAVEQLDPGPDDQLLEIGCGPGVAVALTCERLTGGRIVAIDRSATAIGRATRRNAEHIAAGKAVLLTMALEDLQPADVLAGAERFDKVFAMNVNLFWVRSPTRELDLLKRLLRPGGALYLFYGYGERPQPGMDVENAARVPETLTGHLTESGFTVEVQPGPGVVCVVATPR